MSNGTNDGTLDNFFGILNNPASPAYHNATQLMIQVFCPDNPQQGVPCAGITDYGPQYVGAGEVGDLFNQLFTTFPDLALTPVPGSPRLYSPSDYSPKTIGEQVTLTGTQTGKWFARDHKFYSPPLSDIHPDRVHVMRISACGVFSFDSASRVTRMAIYLDRYRMMQQLTPFVAGTPPAVSPTVSAAQGKRITITIDGG
jgi:hypothetical protein